MPASRAEPLVQIAGIILAAGASQRMGTNKMLLKIDDEAVVRRAVRRARFAGLSPLVVVVGHDAERVQAELNGFTCEFALNADFAGPTSTSVHTALMQLRPTVEAAVVMLADMVHVTGEMVRAIVDTARETGAPLVVSRYGGVIAPPMLYRRSLFLELLAWNDDGSGNAVVKAHLHEAAIKDWPESALADIDTPEDFEKLKS